MAEIKIFDVLPEEEILAQNGRDHGRKARTLEASAGGEEGGTDLVRNVIARAAMWLSIAAIIITAIVVTGEVFPIWLIVVALLVDC